MFLLTYACLQIELKMKYLIILISLGLLGVATALTTQMIILAKEEPGAENRPCRD